MFARMLEFIPKMEKKEEFIKVVKSEILPILKKQTGFLEILLFFPETMTDKVLFFRSPTDSKIKGSDTSGHLPFYPSSFLV